MISTIVALIFLACVICFAFRRPNPTSDLREELGRLKEQLRTDDVMHRAVVEDLEDLREKYNKIQHQKKSSEVKTGFMAESLLPLHEAFPCDPKSLRFLGAPIDYISFNYENDEIIFIECKTGDSQLNENQKKVRDMVEQGKVKFVTVRLNEKGIKVK